MTALGLPEKSSIISPSQDPTFNHIYKIPFAALSDTAASWDVDVLAGASLHLAPDVIRKCTRGKGPCSALSLALKFLSEAHSSPLEDFLIFQEVTDEI